MRTSFQMVMFLKVVITDERDSLFEQYIAMGESLERVLLFHSTSFSEQKRSLIPIQRLKYFVFAEDVLIDSFNDSLYIPNLRQMGFETEFF